MSNMNESVLGLAPEEMEVALVQMLDSRENRADLQKALIERFHRPVISFTMNIAGPVKVSPLIFRAFDEGQTVLLQALNSRGKQVIFKKVSKKVTGCEALFAVDADAMTLKRICSGIEDSHPLGRLFDMDILDTDGSIIPGAPLRGERCCIICGKPGRGCASRRVHSAEELQAKTNSMLRDFFSESDAQYIMSLVSRSLRMEVFTTPKPGLVDLNNNGSHKDMDIYLFQSSISVLAPYFRDFFLRGIETAPLDCEQAFAQLRTLGKDAERAMLETTGGVNTHKGAIFLFGIICGACGRLWAQRDTLCHDPDEIMDMCARLTGRTLECELAAITPQSAESYGEKIYAKYHIPGVRGQAAKGLPAVRRIALPYLRKAVKSGLSLQQAGVYCLLRLIAAVQDTSMIHRGGYELSESVMADMRQLLYDEPTPDLRIIRDLDRNFIRQNLSPGGSADLLSVAFFFMLLEEKE